MATIIKIRNKKGTAYRAQARKFDKGQIIYSKAATFPSWAEAKAWVADIAHGLTRATPWACHGT